MRPVLAAVVCTEAGVVPLVAAAGTEVMVEFIGMLKTDVLVVLLVEKPELVWTTVEDGSVIAEVATTGMTDVFVVQLVLRLRGLEVDAAAETGTGVMVAPCGELAGHGAETGTAYVAAEPHSCL